MDQGQNAGRAGGFTLIELVMVLAIAGIFALIALPRVDLNRYRVNSAMQTAGNSLLAAQRLAITRQRDVVVMFDTAGGALRILDDANNNGRMDAGEHVQVVQLGEHVVFGRGGASQRAMGPGPVAFRHRAGGLPAVTFHRRGSASEAAGFYLTSRRAVSAGGYADDGRAVEVERATGRASWYRYAGGTWTRVL